MTNPPDRLCGACNRNTVLTRPLCPACEGRLRREVLEIPDLVAELNVEVRQQSHKSASNPGGSGGTKVDPGLPLNLDAARVRDALRVFTGKLAQGLGVSGGSSLRLACDLVAHNLEKALASSQAAVIATTLHELSMRAVGQIDQAKERVSIGTCTCGNPLLAWRHVPDPATGVRAERVHRCRECGAEWQVEASYRELENLAEVLYADEMLTPAKVEDATGGRIRAARVRKWIQRGLLASTEEHTVRFGDCLDLEASTRQRRYSPPAAA